MRTEDLILVSVDDHVVEPPSLSDFLRDHVPAKYKDRVPRVIRRDNGTDAWLVEGQSSSRPSGSTPCRAVLPRTGAPTPPASTRSARVATTCTSGSVT